MKHTNSFISHPSVGAYSLLRLRPRDTANRGHPFIKVVSLLKTFPQGGTRPPSQQLSKWSIIAARVIVAVPGIIAVFRRLQQDELWHPRQRDILQSDCHMMNYCVASAYLLALRVAGDIYTKWLWPDKETYWVVCHCIWALEENRSQCWGCFRFK